MVNATLGGAVVPVHGPTLTLHVALTGRTQERKQIIVRARGEVSRWRPEKTRLLAYLGKLHGADPWPPGFGHATFIPCGLQGHVDAAHRGIAERAITVDTGERVPSVLKWLGSGGDLSWIFFQYI